MFPGLGGPSQGCDSSIRSNHRGRAEMRDQGDGQVLVEIRFNGKCAGRAKVGQWVMD